MNEQKNGPEFHNMDQIKRRALGGGRDKEQNSHNTHAQQSAG